MIKKHSKYAFLFLWLVMTISPLYSRVKQSHEVVVGVLQLKDGLNLGMVFNGVQFEYRYGVQWQINTHEIQYQPRFGVGIGFKRGMMITQIHFAPVNVTWTMPVYEQNGHTIRIGANLITDYNYQLLEDLHDAPLFWTAEIGVSPVIHYSYQWNNKQIRVVIQNSLMGFTSHFQGYDPYFWQKTFKDAFVKPHTGLKFGSYNHYNHTTVAFEFVPNILKKHSLVYEFDYLGLFYGNKFGRINHNLIWRISL
jgi:hypothetical protein